MLNMSDRPTASKPRLVYKRATFIKLQSLYHGCTNHRRLVARVTKLIRRRANIRGWSSLQLWRLEFSKADNTFLENL